MPDPGLTQWYKKTAAQLLRFGRRGKGEKVVDL